MIKVKIYGRECIMQGSLYTLLVFKQEFGENLVLYLQDLYKSIQESGVPDYEGFLKIAWAMCRTYSDEVDYYENWLEEFDADLFDLREGEAFFCVMNSVIDAELFREKPTTKERIIRFINDKLPDRRR